MALKLNKKPLDEKEFYQYDGEQSKAVIGDVPLKDTNTSKTPTATPQKTPSSTMSPSKNTVSGLTNKAPSLPEYTAPTYHPSEAVNQAAKMLADQMAKAPGQYNSPWATQLNDTLDKILNREKFSYDFNGDAFYQQYKDKFTQQARMASEDAIARASAMTGGYGNSYAATAGAQAFNDQMGQLNDVIPELFQMAYDRYAREGQDLKDAYSMLAAREAEAYGKYRDEMGDYLAEKDYLTGRLESAKADDLNNRNFEYNAHRDTVEDQKWASEFDLAVDQINKNLELSQREAEASRVAAEKAAKAKEEDEKNKVIEERKKFLDDIGKELPEKFDNNEDMANYLAILEGRGDITGDEAMALLDKYAYADYIDRDWHIEDIGRDPFGAPGVETIFKDQYGNSVSYADIMDELKASGMSQEEADKWMLDLLTKLHGNKEWGN